MEDMIAADVRNISAWHHRFFVVFESGMRKGDEDREEVQKRELLWASLYASIPAEPSIDGGFTGSRKRKSRWRRTTPPHGNTFAMSSSAPSPHTQPSSNSSRRTWSPSHRAIATLTDRPGQPASVRQRSAALFGRDSLLSAHLTAHCSLLAVRKQRL